jgi:hypothetical protein
MRTSSGTTAYMHAWKVYHHSNAEVLSGKEVSSPRNKMRIPPKVDLKKS